MSTKKIVDMAKRGKSVYVIKNLVTGYVKIGISGDVKNRLSSLICSGGCKMELMYSTLKITNSEYIEKTMHKRFGYCRVMGEWFNVKHEVVVEYLKSIENKFMYDDISSLYLDNLSVKEISEITNKSRQYIHKAIEAFYNNPYDSSKEISITRYDRVGRNRYKHKDSGAVIDVMYVDGKFIDVTGTC